MIDGRGLLSGRFLNGGMLAVVMAFSLISVSVKAQTGDQATLNKLELQMVEALRVEDYRAFLNYLREYDGLGGTIVPDMIYYKAVALENEGDVVEAFEEINHFLDKAPSSHAKTKDARALASDLSIKAPPVRGLRTQLLSAKANNEQLTILYDFLNRYQYSSYGDTREAERRIAAIEGPLTLSTPDQRFETPDATSQAIFSQDGTVLATRVGTGLIDTPVYIRNVRDGGYVLRWDSNAPNAPKRTVISFVPGQDLLAIAYSDGSIRFFDYKGKGWLFSVKAPGSGDYYPVRQISFSLDGKRVAAAHENGIMIVYDVETLQPIWTFQSPDPADWGEYWIALSPDGTKLLTSGARKVTAWDIEERKGLYSIDAQDRIDGLLYAPDGKSFVISESEVTHYDVTTGYPVRRHLPGAKSVGNSPSGRYFTVLDGVLTYDSTGNVYDESGSVRVYEPDGRLVAILTGFGMNGECRRDNPRDCRALQGVGLSYDGNKVATTGSDGYLRIWTLP